MGELTEIAKWTLALILAQTSFALVQENLLHVFPDLAGTTGLTLGLLGFAVLGVLIARHVIKGVG